MENHDPTLIINRSPTLNLYDVAASDNLDEATDLNEPPINTKKLCSFDRKLALKAAAFIANSGIFASSAYILINESLTSRNIVVMSLGALINGGTIPPFFYLFLPGETRKKMNTLVSAWSYESILIASQFYLNLVPANQMELYATPFIWALGALEVKDILALITMKQPELTLASLPPSEEENLIPTLGFTTRDQSKAAKIWLAGGAVAAVGLTTLNFLIANQYSKWGDFGQIGMYQDLIALFSGSVAGNLIARFLDDLKEKKEVRYTTQLQLSRQMPMAIKIMRVIKNTFVLFTPIAIGTWLAIDFRPNSVSDYFCKLGVGGLYGANMMIAQREFENPVSRIHECHAVRQANTPRMITTMEKTKAAFFKYVPSVIFLTMLTAFMSWAAVTNIPRVDYAIAVLLSTTFSSFMLTDILVMNYQPRESNRLHNELNFRMIYASIALSIFFQYLTTKVEIGDQQLDSDSNSLYALSLFAWFFWGINVGNNRALNMQEPPIPLVPITPPIATQELSKTCVNNLQYR